MQRFPWRSLAGMAAACALLTPLGVAAADPTTGLGSAADHVTSPDLAAKFATTGKWFVEFAGAPTSSGGSPSSVSTAQDKFLDTVDRQSIPLTVNSTYESLFNGMAVSTDADTAAQLADLPGVVAVYPVFPVDRPEPQTATPDIVNAVSMTGVDIVRSDLGFDGSGIKVGIIDSGVDYDHPDLGGSGTDGATDFPTERVTHGWDFVGDDYNADPTSPGYQPVPNPDAFPDDCGGHGTHVAGIVGAGGEIDGVAPGVTFGAYRVFGCEGSTDTQIILDALELALADGMDVVNMSLGASFQSWPQYPTGVASDRLVDAGVVVVASGGNSGDYFTQAVGSPSVGEKVISVASYDNTHVLLDELLVTDAEGETASLGILPSTGSPMIDDSINGLEIVVTSDPLGCEAETADLTGKIAMIWRGDCTFHEKAVTALNSGASALIIANNQPGTINATVEGETAIEIPVVTITQEDGDIVAGMIEDEDGVVPTAEFTGEKTQQLNPTAGLISDFSSWGLAADLSLKPDLGAPGGSIYSTYPLEEGSYHTTSGTSMAAPHVAGAVALMLQANPELTPAEVLARLQNTAEPSAFSYIPDAGLLDATHHQGAGLVKVDRAIQGTTVVSPGKISVGESADGPHTETLTLTNSSDAAVTYDLSAVDAVATYVDPEDPAATQNDVGFAIWESTFEFSADSVEVPAGGSATVDVTITADAEILEGSIYGGFVVLSGAEGTEPLTVPFAGMGGDYGNINMLPDLDMGLPTLVVVEECNFWSEQQCIDPESVFDYAPADQNYALGEDLPTFALHLALPALRVEVEVLTADEAGNIDEASAQLAYAMDHVGRDGGLSLYSWDGRITTDSGLVTEVDPGHYALRFTAHAPDGDGQTHVWTSPAFGVKVSDETDPEPTPTVTVTATPTTQPTEPSPHVDLYSTPGYHHVNGRDWFTSCEPYSQTQRCRTQILATTITEDNGAFTPKTDWVFNNLTYLPSDRALWTDNPLGHTGTWTTEGGRQWRTECDTAATGRGGCRTYATAQVIEAVPGGGYRWVTKEIFNNMVRFTN